MKRGEEKGEEDRGRIVDNVKIMLVGLEMSLLGGLIFLLCRDLTSVP